MLHYHINKAIAQHRWCFCGNSNRIFKAPDQGSRTICRLDLSVIPMMQDNSTGAETCHP